MNKKRRYILLNFRADDSSLEMLKNGTMDEIMDTIEDRALYSIGELYNERRVLNMDKKINDTMKLYRSHMTPVSLAKNGNIIPYFEFYNTHVEIDDFYMVIEIPV